MDRETFRQRYGQDALDLLEQYINLEQSARSIAKQLHTNYDITVTPSLLHHQERGEEDQPVPGDERSRS